MIAYILGQMVFPIERWPDPVLNARTLTRLTEAAVWVRDQIAGDLPARTALTRRRRVAIPRLMPCCAPPRKGAPRQTACPRLGVVTDGVPSVRA